MQSVDFYYLIAGIAYGIFIVKFVLSLFVGDSDSDIDIDGDAESDFDVSSLLSFKGLLHFCMGCFGYLSVKSMYHYDITTWDYVCSAFIGLVFAFVLYLIYKLCLKFNHIPSNERGTSLVGKRAVIKIIHPDFYTGEVFNGSETIRLELHEQQKVYRSVGQSVIILSYENGKYYI